MATKKKLDHGIVNAGATNPYTTPESVFGPKILHALLSKNRTLNIDVVSGVLTKKKEELIDHLKKAGAKQVLCKYGSEYGFLWDDSLITLTFYKKTNTCSIGWWCTSPKVLDFVSKLESEFLTKNKKNLVFSIIKTTWGLEIKALGDGSSPLIEENYTPDVIEGINYVVEAYKKSPPAGRIVILDGEPGTGKTHLIRSIFTKLDQVCLVVPSNLIASLDGPDFLPLLTNVRDQHEKPIVLIIEDGDACLVPRKSDNISTIASLLNLSDGILGSIIDIKMIISTNATIKEMDSAILRPGRLCKRIEVNALPFEQANKVYQRLMKDKAVSLPKERSYTLAEVYSVFNNKDLPTIETKEPKRPIGFNAESLTKDSLEKSTDRTLNVGGLAKNS